MSRQCSSWIVSMAPGNGRAARRWLRLPAHYHQPGIAAYGASNLQKPESLIVKGWNVSRRKPTWIWKCPRSVLILLSICANMSLCDI